MQRVTTADVEIAALSRERREKRGNSLKWGKNVKKAAKFTWLTMSDSSMGQSRMRKLCLRNGDDGKRTRGKPPNVRAGERRIRR